MRLINEAYSSALTFKTAGGSWKTIKKSINTKIITKTN